MLVVSLVLFAAGVIVYVILLANYPRIYFSRDELDEDRSRCCKCGYDLRGSAHGRCPECGWQREES